MTNDLAGRVAPQLSRPTGIYTTHDVALGDALKVGCLALLQGGELVDADPTAVGNGGTPVMVDRGEHTIPEDGLTQLDNRNGTLDTEEPVVARVVSGEAFLLNVAEDLDGSEAGSDVYALDNDTVQLAQPASEPRVGHIVRVERTGTGSTAFVKIDGLS